MALAWQAFVERRRCDESDPRGFTSLPPNIPASSHNTLVSSTSQNLPGERPHRQRWTGVWQSHLLHPRGGVSTLSYLPILRYGAVKLQKQGWQLQLQFRGRRRICDYIDGGLLERGGYGTRYLGWASDSPPARFRKPHTRNDAPFNPYHSRIRIRISHPHPHPPTHVDSMLISCRAQAAGNETRPAHSTPLPQSRSGSDRIE